jgi:hypothetical protein
LETGFFGAEDGAQRGDPGGMFIPYVPPMAQALLSSTSAVWPPLAHGTSAREFSPAAFEPHTLGGKGKDKKREEAKKKISKNYIRGRKRWISHYSTAALRLALTREG